MDSGMSHSGMEPLRAGVGDAAPPAGGAASRVLGSAS